MRLQLSLIHIYDGQLDLEKQDYLLIGTLESYRAVKRFVGKEKIVPIYIEVEDGERLRCV